MKILQQTVLAAILAVLAIMLAACATQPSPTAAAPEPLRVIVFPGGSSWPLWVAMEKGYLAREKLAVTVTPTPNSTFQMKGLIQGQFDIAMTAIDNVIAYREGQGEAGVVGPDLVAVMGVDPGLLSVAAVPEIRSFADLRGKVLSVDALTTGYAFVLLEMLERNGLVLDRDYRVERAGGALQRYEALLERKHAATMLVSPFDFMAQQRGFNILGSGSDVLGRYQGGVAAVRQSWARANAGKVSGYIRSYAQAIEWLYDPVNKAEAQRIFLANMPPNTPPQAAETAYRALLGGKHGYQRGGRIDLQGVETVVKLRAKYGRAGAILHGAGHYYDPSFHNAAMAKRQMAER